MTHWTFKEGLCRVLHWRHTDSPRYGSVCGWLHWRATGSQFKGATANGEICKIKVHGRCYTCCTLNLDETTVSREMLHICNSIVPLNRGFIVTEPVQTQLYRGEASQTKPAVSLHTCSFMYEELNSRSRLRCQTLCGLLWMIWLNNAWLYVQSPDVKCLRAVPS